MAKFKFSDLIPSRKKDTDTKEMVTEEDLVISEAEEEIDELFSEFKEENKTKDKILKQETINTLLKTVKNLNKDQEDFTIKFIERTNENKSLKEENKQLKLEISNLKEVLGHIEIKEHAETIESDAIRRREIFRES